MVLEMDGRKVPTVSKRNETRPSEPRQPLVPTGRTTAWGLSGAQSGAQQGLQAQDWVCEPQQRGRPSRHWSVSIDERRQLAVLGARERPDAARSSSHCSDIAHTVAELVSENVDRDVLLPHPPQSAASTHAFHAFLTRSAPFWQNAKMEARSPRAPPS